MSTENDAQTPVEAPEAAVEAPKAPPAEPKACECGYFRVLTNLREDPDNNDLTFDEELTTGCGDATTKSTFAPGHDARLKSFLIRMGAAGHSVDRVGDAISTSNSAEHWAKSFGFEAQVLSGIAKVQTRFEEQAARAADRLATREAKEKAAAEAKAAKAEAKAEAARLKEAAKAAAAVAKVDDAPTNAVCLALQAIPENGRPGDAVGATFGTDRDTFETFAKAYLGDKTELTTAQIDGADWDEVFNAFVVDEATREQVATSDLF